MIADKLAQVEDGTIVVDSVYLEFDAIVELHSIMFQTLLDVNFVKCEDDRCSCLFVLF